MNNADKVVSSNSSWWERHEQISNLQGYDYPGFEWDLFFKPHHRYLTNDGYPLGTTCWYISFTACGLRKNICASNAEQAFTNAVAAIIQEIEETLDYYENNLRPHKDSDVRRWKQLLDAIRSKAYPQGEVDRHE